MEKTMDKTTYYKVYVEWRSNENDMECNVYSAV